MAQSDPIRARPGDKPGEIVLTLPPGWDLRMRRVVRELMTEPLPDPHEKGLSDGQRLFQVGLAQRHQAGEDRRDPARQRQRPQPCLGPRKRRVQARQDRMRQAVCRYLADLVAADVVGKEVALSTRNRYGRRSGSLREHVAALLREAAGS